MAAKRCTILARLVVIFTPDLAAIESLITNRTRSIVVINPNNPSGAVYDRHCLQQVVELAERHDLIIHSDEIYDQMTYDDAEFVPLATLVGNTLCLTYSGLSKVYRASGYRVGWCVFSGNLERAEPYIHAMELLAALRLCSNVPGQWAVAHDDCKGCPGSDASPACASNPNVLQVTDMNDQFTGLPDCVPQGAADGARRSPPCSTCTSLPSLCACRITVITRPKPPRVPSSTSATR